MQNRKFYLIVLFFIGLAVGLFAKIVTVGPQEKYKTIQMAIKEAKNNDIILLKQNIFRENINLNDFKGEHLTIEGTNPKDTTIVKSTIIRPKITELPIIKNSRNSIVNLKIVGVSISNAKKGIAFENTSKNCSLYLKNCILKNNHIALYLKDYKKVKIDSCSFMENRNIAIYSYAENNESNLEISRSLFVSNKTALEIKANVQIINCTVANNEIGLKVHSKSHLNLSNSIVFYNKREIIGPPRIITVKYSDIEGGFPGLGNIDLNPQFCPIKPFRYHLMEDSPCIDAGNPNDKGGDEIIDMGCYESYFDIKKLKGNYYHWISFPRAKRKDNEPFDIIKILNGINPKTEGLELRNHSTPVLNYIASGWSNPDYLVKSTQSYKILSWGNKEYYIVERGKRLTSHYTLHLSAGENWVGFWLPGSENWQDALGEFKDAFWQIRAEDWALTKVGGSWIGPQDATFDYGKGYIMFVDKRLYPQGVNFFWTSHKHTLKKYEKEKAKHFKYEKNKRIYEILDIASIDTDKEIKEIGAYTNGICIGASKVKDYPVQILAYTHRKNRGGDDNSIYFKLIYKDGKSELTNNILNYNRKTGKFEKYVLKTTGAGYHYIKLLKGYTPFKPNKTLKLDVSDYNSKLEITYELPFKTYLKLGVYNLKNQLVSLLVEGEYEKGKYSIIWEKSNIGDTNKEGIYLLKLQTADQILTKKIVIVN